MIEGHSSIVTAENLAARYHETPVWEDATFAVERGEFVAIIGPNGAGKTTLFRLLLGLQPPAGGDITVFGERPHRGNPRIGYVPQRHQIDGEMTVEVVELVRLGLSGGQWGPGLFSRADREAAEDALRTVGAEALAHRSLGELSGGELQRAFLALAMVGKPDLLLLDEPLANLDMRREREMVHLVHDVVQSRGVTALLIAHNINPLLPVLDKVIYVANGRVATGKPEDVLTSESLTALYDAPVEVLRDSRGHIAVIGTEDNQPHCG